MKKLFSWVVSKTLTMDIVVDKVYCDENKFIKNTAIALLPIRMLWYLPRFIIDMVKIRNRDLTH